MTAKHLTVWGAGELGLRVAQRWIDAGGSCLCVTRTTTRHAVITEMGAQPICVEDVQTVPDGAIVIATPGAKNQYHAVERLALIHSPSRAVLCNSTACFMAQSPERQRLALDLEEVFFQWVKDQGTSLRFGGLFRTGRGPAASLQRGRKPPVAPAKRVLPLVHYDDAATAVLNALSAHEVDPWYTISIWPMPTRAEFYEQASSGLDIDVEFEHWNPWVSPDYEISRTWNAILPTYAVPDWRSATV